MTPDFTIKRGEVGKALSGQFLDGDENPVDCSGYSAPTFTLRHNKTNAMVIDGAAFTFSNVSEGRFIYRFTSLNLTAMQPDPRGNDFFRGEFKVVLPLETMKSPTDPQQPFLLIMFEDDLST